MEALHEAPEAQFPVLRPHHHLERLLNDQDLQFPRLHAEHEILDLSSSDALPVMRPAYFRQSSDVASSVSASFLEDSAYDIVNLTDGESEDGNRSESLASVDGDTESNLDDASIVPSPYDSDHESGSDVDKGFDPTEPQNFMNVHRIVTDSGYTTRAYSTLPSAAASVSYLAFKANEDPFEDSIGEDVVNVVCDIADPHEPSTLRELSVYNSAHVGLSLSMAIKQSEPYDPFTKSSFRILVVAHHFPLALKIADHVEDALFSDRPDGHIRLEIMECTGSDREHGAYQLEINGEDAPILVAGNHMYMNDSEYSLPTLAIFLHPSLADVPAHTMDDVERHFTLVRHAMQACQIPILDFSEHAPLYRAAPYSYTQTTGSMHLRVSTMDSDKQNPRVVDILPVDRDRFLQIDPRTVNAHLSYIFGQNKANIAQSTLKSTNHVETSMDTVRTWYRQCSEHTGRRRGFVDLKAGCGARITQSQQRVVKGWRNMNLQQRVISITATITVMISLFYYSLFAGNGHIRHIDSNALLSSEVNMPAPNTPSAVGWLSETLFGTTASAKSATSVVKAMQPVVTASKSSSKIIIPKACSEPEKKVETGLSKTPEKSLGQHFPTKPSAVDEPFSTFKVNVVDGNHIVLKPNRTSRFGHLLLRATVSRNDEVIKTDVRPGPNGSYTIEMPLEDAYGLVNLTIRWEPGHSQIAKVDMGSVWLKASSWGDALSNLRQTIKEPLAVAQANTRAISIRVATGISKFARAVTDVGIENTPKASFWKSIIEAPSYRRDLQPHENSIPVRLGKTFGVAHVSALTSWYDTIETIRAVNVKQALLKKPVQVFKRGKDNGKDLGKVIGGHASNIWNGCLKESAGSWRCGLACLNARAEACARRKAEEAAAAKHTGPKTIGEKATTAKKVRSKAKVS